MSETAEAPDKPELDLFARFRQDFAFYAPRALRIRPKAGSLVPFQMNSAQRRVHEAIEKQRAATGVVRAVVLKGRQQGISTYVQARFFWRITHGYGLRAFILTHLDSTTDNLYGMVEAFYEYCPPELKPKLGAANAKELSFKTLRSGYKVATAGARGAGVGDTLQLFHGCLGLDTPVVCPLTGKLLRMGDMQVGDRVRTHTGEIAPISAVSDQVKPVYSVKLKGLQDFPIIATGEHKFWTDTGFMDLEQIRRRGAIRLGGVCIGFPVFDITDEVSSLPFAIPPPVRPQGGGIIESVPATVTPSYALGRIVGLYLAEGSILRQSNIFRRATGIIFSVHKREVQRTLDWLAEVSDIFSTVRVDHRPGNGAAVVVSGRSLAEWMIGLVGEKDTKRFPEEWARMGTSFARGMVHGYVAGDGHSAPERDRRISVTSIRSATITGLRDALASLGYGWAGVSYKEAGERHERQEKEAWTLRLTGAGVDTLAAELGWSCPPRKRVGQYGAVEVSGGYAWVPIVSIEEAGEQPVRDFEVEHEDHSYCILQGATHNSEMSKWPNGETHISGALQAVPYSPGTEVILESTSDGPSGVFYDFCMAAQRGESDYQLIFVPWFMQTEYRRPVTPEFEPTGEELAVAEEFGLDVAQLAWRRAKVRELRGLQEFGRQYPATIEEAFKVEAPGALWKQPMLDACRIGKVPEMRRIVVAIDPSAGKSKTHTEVGIVVAGKSWDGQGFVLEDASGKYSPSGWAKKAVALYQKWGADRIIAERNFGGDLVEANLRAEAPNIPYKDVVASRGKSQRAEPVVALYEQGQIRHVGMFPALEDEMITWQPGISVNSPNRVDALVWAMTDLLLGDGYNYDVSMRWVNG